MPLPAEQYAFLSSAIYDPLTPHKYIESDTRQYEVLYVSPPSATNYRGAVVRDITTKQLIVTNKGTDPLSGHDLIADYGMGMMGAPTQWPEAAATMRWALDYARKQQIPLSDVSTTGHSLGGAHAQLQAAMAGVHAKTFNAYGADTMAKRLGMDVDSAHERVVNHRMYHDPVSAIARPIGSTVDYMDHADYQRHQPGHWRAPLEELGAVATAHGISNFWDKQHNRPAAVFAHNYMQDLQRQRHPVLNLPPGVPMDLPMDLPLHQLAPHAALPSGHEQPLARNASADDIFNHLCAALETGNDQHFMQALMQAGQTDFCRELNAQAVERVNMEDRQFALQAQLQQAQQQLAAQQAQSHAKVLSR